MKTVWKPIRSMLRPYVRAGRRLAERTISVDELAYGRMMSMSQFGEDVVLRQLFGEQQVGFYVDVGALDPFNGSNTYAMWRRGWRGINIDPVPEHIAAFERYRPGDTNLRCAIGSRRGEAAFVVRGSFSGLDTETYLWGSPGQSGVITVDVMSLASVLDEHVPPGVRVDLLDVDCEGADADVLRSNDWARFRPRVVLAERHESEPGLPRDEPYDVLRQEGYTLVNQVGLTGIFVAPDALL